MSDNTPLASVTQLPVGPTIPDELVKIPDDLQVGEAIGHQEIKAVFGDDTWDLTGHPGFTKKSHPALRTMDFTKAPPWARPLIKRWALFRLNPKLTSTYGLDRNVVTASIEKQRNRTNKSIRPATVVGNLFNLGWVLSQMNENGLRTVKADEWDQVAWLMKADTGNGVPKVATLRRRARYLQQFHEFSEAVGWESPFGSFPFGDRTSKQVFPTIDNDEAHGLNKTRPTVNVGPWLGMATYVIDHLLDDIVDHTEWWHDTRRSMGQPTGDRAEIRRRLKPLLQEQADKHGAVAGIEQRTGLKIAYHPLQWLAGFTDNGTDINTDHFVKQLNVGPKVGVPVCPLPISQLDTVDGGQMPWVDSLLWHPAELKKWVSTVVYAVAVYLNATLGLRDLFDRSMLQLGCVKSETEMVDGLRVTRHWLHGHKTKNLNDTPVPTKWPIGARAAHAIHQIERLHEILDATEVEVDPRLPGSTALFTTELMPVRLGVAANVDPQPLYLRTDEEGGGWVGQLRWAAKHLKERGLLANDLDDVPYVSNRQMRITALHAYADRTLGQAIARRMGGWRNQGTGDGYVADVFESVKFTADFKDIAAARHETIVATLRHMTANAETIDGNGALKGEAVTNANLAALVTFQQDGSWIPNLNPLTKAEVKAIGQENETVERSMFTVCIYDPKKALCGGSGSPDFRFCRPGACANSAMTLGHMAGLELRRRLAEDHPAFKPEADQITEDAGEFIDDAEIDGIKLIDMDEDQLLDVIDAETEEYLGIRLRVPSDDETDDEGDD